MTKTKILRFAALWLLMLFVFAFHTQESSCELSGNAFASSISTGGSSQGLNDGSLFNYTFEAGKNKLKSGDYAGAINDFTAAINCGDENQDLAIVFLNRGAAYAHLGNNSAAVDDYNSVLKLRPNSPEAYTNRGLAYHELGKNDFAISDLNEAVRLAPGQYTVYTNRGVTFGEMGEYEKAIDDFNYAIKLKGNYYYKAYWGRALAYIGSGKYDLSLSDLNLIIDDNFNDFDARFLRGGVYVIKGDYNRGISALSGVIKYSKDNKPALFLRGMTYIVVGNYESAVDDFAELVGQHTTIDDVAISPGLKPIFDWYVPKVLNEQLAKTNSNAEIIFIKGLVENMRDEKEKSLADFNDAVKMKPSLAKKLPWWIRRELAN